MGPSQNPGMKTRVGLDIVDDDDDDDDVWALVKRELGSNFV